MFNAKLQCKSLFIILLVSNNLGILESARILAMLPFPSPSHAILATSLLKELSARGHEVTWISSYPLKEKVHNFRNIYIEQRNLIKVRDEAFGTAFTLLRVAKILKYCIVADDLLLSDKKIKALLASGEKFDLVLNMGMESLLGLSHAVNAPTIRFSVLGMYSIHAAFTGNPLPSAYVPYYLLPYSEDMTFLQRTMNTILNVFSDFYMEYIWMNMVNANVQKHFPGAPHLSELQRTAQVTFVNTHMAVQNVRPHLTNVIQIGGFHLQVKPELSEELRVFLDNANDGVILFSLGSIIKPDALGDKLHVLLKCLASLPYKVLWKNDRDIEGQPANVKTMKWTPQQAVLGHPNVKLFITHGGLGSVLEAVYHAVPMIFLPFFLDQETNAAQNVHNGFALRLDPRTLTEDKLLSAIHEITTNPAYYNEIASRSQAFRYQEVNPMEKAMFWVERVLKQNNTNYLNCAASQMPLYQYYLLDVYGLIIAALIIFWVLVRKASTGWMRICKTKLKQS